MSDNEFMIRLLAELEKYKSKTQINKDIKELEKVINTLHLTAALSKGNSKKEINQMIRHLEGQLNQIKLRAKIDQKNLKSDINKTLNSLSFKDIDIGVTEGKTKLKVQKVIADAKKVVQNNPISINIDLKKDKLNNQLTTYLTKNSKIRESEVLLKEADKIREKISSINDRDSLRNATDSFQLFKSSVSATGFQTKSTTEKVSGLVKGITKVGSVFGVASIAVNNFRKSLSTIKTNDSILTEISKTSNSTKQQLGELGNSSFKSASKYGQISSDYLKAVQEMNRSGFYNEKGEALGELTLKTEAAGNVTTETAQKYLLATNAAYDYKGSIEKLTAVLDGQNLITNRNSVDMETMATATEKAGSVAANAGIKINELSAMIGTISARTKEAGEKTGTGIKSLIVNLQNISSDKIVNTLKKANASMTETINGVEKLRNPIEILKDLAKTYNSLDEKDPLKSEITTNIGQKFHANQLSALLSGWKDYEKMLKDYSEGIGSSEIEAKKTADSLQGRLNVLQNSWDSFVNSLTSKSAIKGGVSFLDGLIQSTETLIDTLGEVPVILTSITAGITALNKDYGLTQVINPETKKLDLQGNLFGIDFTQIKQQKAHFEEASVSIDSWNQKLSNGVTDINSFNDATVKNNAQLKAYLQTCSSDAPASLQGYQSYLKAAGISTDALRLKTILLNSVISLGLGLAIQGVISIIAEMTQRTEELHNKASELGSEFSDTTSDIDSYKNKISELQKVINDSGSSIEDVTNARKQLMEIQNELIQKYGKEESKIKDITSAINGQIGALENLKKSEWYDTKSEYNMKTNDDNFIDFVTETIPYYFEKIMLLGDDGKRELPKSKLEDMLDEWNNQEYSLESTGNQKLDELLSKSFGIPLTDGKFKLGGSINDLKDDLSRIKEIVGSYEVSPDFEESLGKVSNDVKEIYENDSNMRNQSILFDVVLSEDPDNVYDELYERIKSAKDKYDTAILDGDESKISSAADSYAKVVSDAIQTAINNDDFDVADYFENIYPELKEKFSQWRFEVSFKANTNNIKDSVEDSLKILDGFSLEDLQQFNVNTATQEQISAFGTLRSVANEYGVSLEQLLTLLEQLGLVQTENYQELLELFGEDNIKKIAPEDLTFAYRIKNAGDMTFEEFQKAIEKTKEESQKTDVISFSKSWANTSSETKEALLELAKAGELTPETLESTEEYNKLLTQTGLTAEQVANKINKMVDSSDQLASMGSGIKSLSENLGTKKENPKQAIGYDTLAGMSDKLKECTKEWEEYERVVGNANSSYEDCRKATNKLATAFVNSNNFLAKLTNSTKDEYISQLKLMGVANAEAVVTETLKNKKAELNAQRVWAKATTLELSNATYKQISAIATEKNWTEETTKSILQLAFKQQLLNSNPIDTTASVNNLLKLAKQAGITGEAVAALAEEQKYLKLAQNSKSMLEYAQNMEKAKKAKEKAKNAKTKYELDYTIDPPSSSTNSKSKSSNPKTKETKESKEIIDWIDRRLTSINNKLSLIKAQYENIASIVKGANFEDVVEKQNANLSTQITLLTRLYNTATRGADKYLKKANSIKLSSSLKKLVKTESSIGKKTSYKDLIKQYGQSTADKIAKYRDYYDKYMSAKQSAQDYKNQINQAKIQKHQNRVDLYQSTIDKHNANKDIATSASDKEKSIKKQIDYTKKLYSHQIAIAKLEGNNHKVAQLEAEQKKAILDYQVEIKQNYADEAEARYNLNKQYEENAVSAKDKNKYEAKSLSELKKQYNYLISIAKLQGDVTEQNRLQAEYEAKKEESLKTQYDNIKNEYDRKVNLNNSKISTVQAEISALEANGRVASEAFYKGLLESTAKNKDILLDELADLELQLSNFTPEDENWYAIKEDIESVTQAIYSCDESLAQFQKSWNELKLRRFDLINSEFEFANEHIDFLTDYLSHKDLTSKDSAGLTDDGFATISLDFSKMENNAKIIENAQKGLAELQKQIADGTSLLTEEEQMEAIKKYLDIIRDAKLGIEDLKDSILDLVNNAFDVMLDSLNELISKRKEALQREKDYKKKLFPNYLEIQFLF